MARYQVEQTEVVRKVWIVAAKTERLARKCARKWGQLVHRKAQSETEVSKIIVSPDGEAMGIEAPGDDGE